jgi:hypothetical protein
MNELELWKQVPYLSVDEAMNLILGCIPGKYKFDFSKEKDIPTFSIPIYRLLTDAIKKLEITVYFDGEAACIENIGKFVAFETFYYGTWWNKGKLETKELINWLSEKNIDSAFSEIPHIQELNQVAIPNYLNQDHPNYSNKLAAAVKAWEAVTNNPELSKGKSVKKAISIWLSNNAEDLGLIHQGKVSETAIEEISKVANWATGGGAPKSPL